MNKLTEVTVKIKTDSESAVHYIRGLEYHALLSEIFDKCFRPAQKHGYSNLKVQKLLDSIPDDLGEELIWEVSKIYFEILNSNDVSN